jgi:hypothetical protein
MELRIPPNKDKQFALPPKVISWMTEFAQNSKLKINSFTFSLILKSIYTFGHEASLC